MLEDNEKNKKTVRNENGKKIGIGIDTGGTFTDAVIYDFEKNEIVASSKALTTKEDLSKGILEAIDALPKEYLCKTTTVSLSTTLATNACVENKEGSANLILIGADKRVFQKVGDMYGLTDKSRILFVDLDVKAECQNSVDWDCIREYCEQLKNEGAPDAMAIVQIFARERNAAEEKYAKNIVEEIMGVPVVCGHELHNDLNVFRRGAETMLNAGLISVIKGFLESIKFSMNARDINTNMVVMRSDGTLMSESFAEGHPVETLLCGPAASVIGAQALAKSQNAIVVDMGGTTTDVAIIEKGVPVKVTDGVQVGRWRTFVKGVFIDTFALGGDSGIHVVDRKVQMQSERFIPLCILSSQYPEARIAERLRAIVDGVEYHTQPLTDFFVLKKPLPVGRDFTQAEKDLCSVLENGPLSYSEAAEIMKSDVYSMRIHRLEKEGYIMRAGLTPTDIMHVKGDFSKYDVEASKLAVQFAAKCTCTNMEDVGAAVYNEVVKKMYCNIVRISIEKRYPKYVKSGIGEGLEQMIELSYEEAVERVSGQCNTDNIFHSIFATDFELVGIGAPIHVFLPKVAELLGTTCAIPNEARVGNAVGAVAGNISASVVVDIKPLTEKVDIAEANQDGRLPQFVVYSAHENGYFVELDEAVEWATEQAKEEAVNKAKNQGVIGELVVTVDVEDSLGQAKDVDVYMGTKIIATAVGR